MLPHKLPPGAAQVAADVDFSNGDLRGLRANQSDASIASGVKSIYLHDATTHTWTTETCAMRGPVVGDAHNRFYRSNGTAFLVQNGGAASAASFRVGVPNPVAAPTLHSAQSFAMNGVAVLKREIACEMSDGSLAGRVALGNPTATTESRTGQTATFSNPLSCVAATSETGGVLTATERTVDATITPPKEEYNSTPQAYIQKVGIYTFSDNYYAKQPIPVAFPGFEYVPTCAFPAGWSYLGAGWWSTTAGAPLPTDAGEVAVSVTQKGPVLILTFARESNTALTATLRNAPDVSEWPPELADYTGSVTITSSTVTTQLGKNPAKERARVYAYTYVNSYGEESGLSDTLFLEKVVDGDPLSIVCAANALSGYQSIDKIRLYRTSSGSTSTDYLFVKEQGVASGYVVVDDVLSANLGESAQTIGVMPPDQDLFPVGMMANGVLYGLKKNEIHFSDPYLPAVWRKKNIQSLPYRAIGAVATENGLYVTTAAYPYLVSGVSPDSMTQMKLPAIQAGVSHSSIANMGNMLVWASNDGLVTCRGLDASLEMGQKFWTRKEWRASYGPNLPKLNLSVHDGRLLGWFSNSTSGAPVHGFIINFDEVAPSLSRLRQVITSAFVHPDSDALYVGNPTGMSLFGGSTPPTELAWQWVSRTHHMAKPVSFGALQVFGQGKIDLQIYADDALVVGDGADPQFTYKQLDLSGTTNPGLKGFSAVRLASGRMATRWVICFASLGGRVQEYTLATAMGELKNG